MRQLRILGMALTGLAASLTLTATPATAGKIAEEKVEMVEKIQAMKKPVVCVFDFLGSKGPIYGVADELRLLSKLDGLEFELQAYTNERIATKDFTTENCAGLVATGLRTRQFNNFAGSIEAIGAATQYPIMERTLDALQDKKFAPFLQNDKYAIAGIIPVGKLFFFVNDRSINSLGKAAGKRVASMDYDKAQSKLIAMAGASAVSSDVARFMTQFNNNAVDVVVAPAYAYKKLELYRGIGTKGAVIDFPLTILTYQIVLNRSEFSDAQIARIRALAHTKVGMAISAAQDVEKDIPDSQWEDLSDDAKAEYEVAMRDARVELRNEGIYDDKMLKLLRIKRCEIEPTDAECSMKVE